MWLSKVLEILGVNTIFSACRDIHLLYLSRFLRTSAFGATGLILAVFLSRLGHSETKIGLFMTLTLGGDVILSLALTSWADQLGRRRTVLLGSCLMIFSGVVFAVASNYWVFLFAAIFGVISPSGNEIGPFRAVEEGMIASLSSEQDLSDIFAGHIVAGTLGVSFGTFIAGKIILVLQELSGWTEHKAFRGVFALYAIIGIAKAIVATQLSNASEVTHRKAEWPIEARDEETQGMLQDDSVIKKTTRTAVSVNTALKRTFLPELSTRTAAILWKLCLMFAVDSFASGMIAL